MGSIDDRELARRATIRAAVRDRLRTKSLDQVRAELIDNVGFNWYQLEVMREWVAEKDAEAEADRLRIEHRDRREFRADQNAEESLRISRSAKNASWFASGIAILALVVAAYAALREYPINHDRTPVPQAAQRVAAPIHGRAEKSGDRHRRSPQAKEQPALQR